MTVAIIQQETAHLREVTPDNGSTEVEDPQKPLCDNCLEEITAEL